MSKTAWTSDIRCPACGTLQGQHADFDYRTEFEVECSCGATFDVHVEVIPEFYATLRSAGPQEGA
jgi:hypothetical protein